MSRKVEQLAQKFAELDLDKVRCACGRDVLRKNLKRHQQSKICKRESPFDQKEYCKVCAVCPLCNREVVRHQMKRHQKSEVCRVSRN